MLCTAYAGTIRKHEETHDKSCQSQTARNTRYRSGSALSRLGNAGSGKLHEANLYPLEFVYIWNKNSGQRISTYVLHGIPGSRCCIMNGAAARTCQPGDEVIICAAEYLQSPEELCRLQPHVLAFNQDNTGTQHLRYDVSRDECPEFHLAILDMPD